MRRNREAVSRWNEASAAAHRAAAHRAAARYRRPDRGRVLLENIFPLDEQDPDDIAPSGECPFLGQEAWVAADGRFNPCCAPDALRRTLGDFGNLNDRGLREIWESAEYRQLRDSYRGRPAMFLSRRLCQGCNMRRPQ